MLYGSGWGREYFQFLGDMYSYIFNIAEITISLELERQIKVTPPFLPFRESQCDTGCYHGIFRKVPELPDCGTNIRNHRIEYDVFQNDGLYIRRFHDHRRDDKPYAVAKLFPDKKQILIEYLPEGGAFLSESGNCFFHTMWELVLSLEKRIILHASCIESEYGGILFSGPSGIGKSTQASLWCQYYPDTRVLNGDRPILWKKNGEWRAYGSPYAGSSKVYVNASCPVRAIVMLKKASHCSLRRMETVEAFQSVFSGLTVNTWDRQFVSNASGEAIDLVNCIPVYELSCTPDRNAVELLRMELSKEREK